MKIRVHNEPAECSRCNSTGKVIYLSCGSWKVVDRCPSCEGALRFKAFVYERPGCCGLGNSAEEAVGALVMLIQKQLGLEFEADEFSDTEPMNLPTTVDDPMVFAGKL